MEDKKGKDDKDKERQKIDRNQGMYYYSVCLEFKCFINKLRFKILIFLTLLFLKYKNIV